MFIFMISIVFHVLSNLHNVLVTWVMCVLLIVCLCFLVIGVIQMKFFVVLYHLIKKKLKFEIFFMWCKIPNSIRIFGKPTKWKFEFYGSGILPRSLL